MNFLYILLAVFIFGVLIFIHELGHFLVARLCGVKVLEFAIGMGPKLFGWTSKRSGTKYAIRLLPIGGFVSMLGEGGMEIVQGEQPTSNESEEKTETPIFLQSEGEDTKEPSGDTDTLYLSEEEAKHAYCNQSVWKRILISLAGPAMNVLLGFVLMLVIIAVSGKGTLGNTTVAEFHVVYSAEESYGGLQNGDYVLMLDENPVVSFAQMKELVAQKNGDSFKILVERWNEDKTDTVIVELSDVVLSDTQMASAFTSSLSEQAGLLIGDVVLKVNRVRVHTANELVYEISNQGYRPVQLTVLRNGEQEVLKNVIFPSYEESGAVFGNMDFRVYPEENFHLGTILKHTWFRSVSTVKMVFDSLGGLFSGRYGMEAVSGPVGITKTISEVAKVGWENVLYLVTVISINLGVMNLLPFPALDGGHLLIYFIEVIRRKPMKKELEATINFIGLIILLALAFIILVKDIIAL
ncbi:MAG: RIP metalloprotease RseP [Clostridia bacterium]|nr:RIP metalloprotease RseP [Clostridia bacterium]